MDAPLLRAGLAGVDFALAAVCWLILLCTYPDFARWRAEGFAAAHDAYTRKVGWVIGPLLGLQMAGHLAAALLSRRLPRPRLGGGLLGADRRVVGAVPPSAPRRRAGVARLGRVDPLAPLADGAVDAHGHGFHMAGRGLTANGRA